MGGVEQQYPPLEVAVLEFGAAAPRWIMSDQCRRRWVVALARGHDSAWGNSGLADGLTGDLDMHVLADKDAAALQRDVPQ